MTSEDTDTNLGPVDETVPPAEHDYAHAAVIDSTSTEATSPSVTPAAESSTAAAQSAHISPEQPTLPAEPTVGAEVDCSGGVIDVGASVPQRTEEDTRKTPARRAGPRRHKQPGDVTCSTCKVAFERRGRSFNRRAVFTFTNPETVRWVFPDSAAQDKSFLCETCAQVIRNKCKRKQSGKRPLWLKPAKPSEGKDKKKKKPIQMGKKSKAAMLVSKSCYKAALKMLWSTKGARKPMMEFWRKQLKEEMKALARQADSPFQQKVSSLNPLSSFPWRCCLSWAQDKAPLVTTCLTSLFPDMNALFKNSHQMSAEMAETLLTRRAVLALSIPLFTRNIWKNNFLQAALGAELRMQGCSCSALDILNTLGLCQNRDTVRLLLQKLQNSKKTQTLNGRRMKIPFEQMIEQMMDVDDVNIKAEDVEVGVEEEDEEEEEEEEEEEAEEAADDDDEEEEEEEEVEEEVVQDGMLEEAEDVQAVEEKSDTGKKRKKRGKQKVKEVEGEVADDNEAEEEDDALEEVEEEEVRDGMPEEAEEIPAVAEKSGRGKKRKVRGKRKVMERVEVEEEEDEDSQQKKRRVVVVRLGLLKGHSEVGRADLSAP
ncbi:uncharacterized protein AB9W97_003631 [Spinachia spinachia]